MANKKTFWGIFGSKKKESPLEPIEETFPGEDDIPPLEDEKETGSPYFLTRLTVEKSQATINEIEKDFNFFNKKVEDKADTDIFYFEGKSMTVEEGKEKIAELQVKLITEKEKLAKAKTDMVVLEAGSLSTTSNVPADNHLTQQKEFQTEKQIPTEKVSISSEEEKPAEKKQKRKTVSLVDLDGELLMKIALLIIPSLAILFGIYLKSFWVTHFTIAFLLLGVVFFVIFLCVKEIQAQKSFNRGVPVKKKYLQKIPLLLWVLSILTAIFLGVRSLIIEGNLFTIVLIASLVLLVIVTFVIPTKNKKIRYAFSSVLFLSLILLFWINNHPKQNKLVVTDTVNLSFSQAQVLENARLLSLDSMQLASEKVFSDKIDSIKEAYAQVIQNYEQQNRDLAQQVKVYKDRINDSAATLINEIYVKRLDSLGIVLATVQGERERAFQKADFYKNSLDEVNSEQPFQRDTLVYLLSGIIIVLIFLFAWYYISTNKRKKDKINPDSKKEGANSVLRIAVSLLLMIALGWVLFSLYKNSSVGEFISSKLKKNDTEKVTGGTVLPESSVVSEDVEESKDTPEPEKRKEKVVKPETHTDSKSASTSSVPPGQKATGTTIYKPLGEEMYSRRSNPVNETYSAKSGTGKAVPGSYRRKRTTYKNPPH